MASTPDLGQSFIFNPHIIWDPIGPWLDANPGAANQIMLHSSAAPKDVLALQSKAIDQAMGVVNKAGG